MLQEGHDIIISNHHIRNPPMHVLLKAVFRQSNAGNVHFLATTHSRNGIREYSTLPVDPVRFTPIRRGLGANRISNSSLNFFSFFGRGKGGKCVVYLSA